MKWKGTVLMLNESDDEWKKNEKKKCVCVCVCGNYIVLFSAEPKCYSFKMLILVVMCNSSDYWYKIKTRAIIKCVSFIQMCIYYNCAFPPCSAPSFYLSLTFLSKFCNKTS